MEEIYLICWKIVNLSSKEWQKMTRMSSRRSVCEHWSPPELHILETSLGLCGKPHGSAIPATWCHLRTLLPFLEFLHEIREYKVCSFLQPVSSLPNLLSMERDLHEPFLQKYLEGHGKDLPVNTPASQIADSVSSVNTVTLSRALITWKFYGKTALSNHDVDSTLQPIFCQK